MIFGVLDGFLPHKGGKLMGKANMGSRQGLMEIVVDSEMSCSYV